PSKPTFTVSTAGAFSLRVYRPTVTHMVTRSYAATDEIAMASVAGIAADQLVEIRQRCGGVLHTSLDAPGAIGSYGIIERFLDRPELRGETNLVPNSYQRTWTGGAAVAADGWALSGGATIGRTADPLFTKYGGYAAILTLPGTYRTPRFRVWR